MKWFNANFFHNVANFIMILVVALVGFDWTVCRWSRFS